MKKKKTMKMLNAIAEVLAMQQMKINELESRYEILELKYQKLLKSLLEATKKEEPDEIT